jgi:hypothetical protein
METLSQSFLGKIINSKRQLAGEWSLLPVPPTKIKPGSREKHKDKN